MADSRINRTIAGKPCHFIRENDANFTQCDASKEIFEAGAVSRRSSTLAKVRVDHFDWAVMLREHQ